MFFGHIKAWPIFDNGFHIYLSGLKYFFQQMDNGQDEDDVFGCHGHWHALNHHLVRHQFAIVIGAKAVTSQCLL